MNSLAGLQLEYFIAISAFAIASGLIAYNYFEKKNGK